MKNNNKGFSLVELIVVIAIMAVLVGVLAPSLLRYVEKSRIQKDASAVGEVAEAIKIALGDEDIFNDTKNGAKITVSTGAAPANGENAAKLATELGKSIGTVTFSGKTKGTVTLTIHITDEGNVSMSTTTDGTGEWKTAVEKVS